jgi:hypothetical protein
MVSKKQRGDLLAVAFPQSETQNAIPIFKGTFEPRYERGVHNALDVSRIIAFGEASPTFGLFPFTTNDQPLCCI